MGSDRNWRSVEVPWHSRPVHAHIWDQYLLSLEPNGILILDVHGLSIRHCACTSEGHSEMPNTPAIDQPFLKMRWQVSGLTFACMGIVMGSMSPQNLAFLEDCYLGKFDAVKLALQQSDVEPATGQSVALQAAAMAGHTEIIDLLLKDGRSDPSLEEQLPLLFAIQHGHIDATARLIQDHRMAQVMKSSLALMAALRYQMLDIVDLLLRDGRLNMTAQADMLLQVAIQLDDPSFMIRLLRDDRFLRAIPAQDVLDRAVAFSNVLAIEFMLERPLEFAITAHHIGVAVFHNHLSVLNRLVADRRRLHHPMPDYNVIFNAACGIADAIMIKRVYDLGDGNITRQTINNCMLWSVRQGNEEFVHMILDMKLFDLASAAGKSTILLASSLGWHAIMDRFLVDSSKIMEDVLMLALQVAMKSDQHQVVCRLLKDDRVRPRTRGFSWGRRKMLKRCQKEFKAVINARRMTLEEKARYIVEENFVEPLEALLKDGRLNVAVVHRILAWTIDNRRVVLFGRIYNHQMIDKWTALLIAVDHRRLYFIHRILSDASILLQDYHLSQLLIRATETKRLDVVEYLLKHERFASISSDGLTQVIKRASELKATAIADRLLQHTSLQPSFLLGIIMLNLCHQGNYILMHRLVERTEHGEDIRTCLLFSVLFKRHTLSNMLITHHILQTRYPAVLTQKSLITHLIEAKMWASLRLLLMNPLVDLFATLKEIPDLNEWSDDVVAHTFFPAFVLRMDACPSTLRNAFTDWLMLERRQALCRALKHVDEVDAISEGNALFYRWRRAIRQVQRGFRRYYYQPGSPGFHQAQNDFNSLL